MILLVENDPDDVFLLQRVLQKLGWTEPMHVAPDGRDALDYLQAFGEYADRDRYPLPSIILLDLKLPRVHGFEVLEWVGGQPLLAKIPVVVLSSSAQNSDRNRALESGAKHFVVKPAGAGIMSDILQSTRREDGTPGPTRKEKG